MTEHASLLVSARSWRPSFRPIALAGIVIAAAAALAAATPQVTPPSGGTIDTVAVEGTIDIISPGTLTVRAIDGTTHLFKWLEKAFVHGTAETGDELKGLQKGMTVVVHYSATGESATAEEIDRIDGGGLRVTEGRVTSIDRQHGEIKVRLDDNRMETLKLSNRVSRNVGKNTIPNTRVVVYYTDDKGVKVVHYFKQK